MSKIRAGLLAHLKETMNTTPENSRAELKRKSLSENNDPLNQDNKRSVQKYKRAESVPAHENDRRNENDKGITLNKRNELIKQGRKLRTVIKRIYFNKWYKLVLKCLLQQKQWDSQNSEKELERKRLENEQRKQNLIKNYKTALRSKRNIFFRRWKTIYTNYLKDEQDYSQNEYQEQKARKKPIQILKSKPATRNIQKKVDIQIQCGGGRTYTIKVQTEPKLLEMATNLGNVDILPANQHTPKRENTTKVFKQSEATTLKEISTDSDEIESFVDSAHSSPSHIPTIVRKGRSPTNTPTKEAMVTSAQRRSSSTPQRKSIRQIFVTPEEEQKILQRSPLSQKSEQENEDVQNETPKKGEKKKGKIKEEKKFSTPKAEKSKGKDSKSKKKAKDEDEDDDEYEEYEDTKKKSKSKSKSKSKGKDKQKKSKSKPKDDYSENDYDESDYEEEEEEKHNKKKSKGKNKQKKSKSKSKSKSKEDSEEEETEEEEEKPNKKYKKKSKGKDKKEKKKSKSKPKSKSKSKSDDDYDDDDEYDEEESSVEEKPKKKKSKKGKDKKSKDKKEKPKKKDKKKSKGKKVEDETEEEEEYEEPKKKKEKKSKGKKKTVIEYSTEGSEEEEIEKIKKKKDKKKKPKKMKESEEEDTEYEEVKPKSGKKSKKSEDDSEEAEAKSLKKKKEKTKQRKVKETFEEEEEENEKKQKKPNKEEQKKSKEESPKKKVTPSEGEEDQIIELEDSTDEESKKNETTKETKDKEQIIEKPNENKAEDNFDSDGYDTVSSDSEAEEKPQVEKIESESAEDIIISEDSEIAETKEEAPEKPKEEKNSGFIFDFESEDTTENEEEIPKANVESPPRSNSFGSSSSSPSFQLEEPPNKAPPQLILDTIPRQTSFEFSSSSEDEHNKSIDNLTFSPSDFKPKQASALDQFLSNESDEKHISDPEPIVRFVFNDEVLKPRAGSLESKSESSSVDEKRSMFKKSESHSSPNLLVYNTSEEKKKMTRSPSGGMAPGSGMSPAKMKHAPIVLVKKSPNSSPTGSPTNQIQNLLAAPLPKKEEPPPTVLTDDFGDDGIKVDDVVPQDRITIPAMVEKPNKVSSSESEEEEFHPSEIPVEMNSDSLSDVDIADLIRPLPEPENEITQAPPKRNLWEAISMTPEDEERDKSLHPHFNEEDFKMPPRRDSPEVKEEPLKIPPRSMSPVYIPMPQITPQEVPIVQPKPSSEIRNFIRKFFTPEIYANLQREKALEGQPPIVEIPESVPRPGSFMPDYIDIIVDLINEMVVTCDISALFYEAFLDKVEDVLKMGPIDKEAEFTAQLDDETDEYCDIEQINTSFKIADDILYETVCDIFDLE